jgi:hypothetical protein
MGDGKSIAAGGLLLKTTFAETYQYDKDVGDKQRRANSH